MKSKPRSQQHCCRDENGSRSSLRKLWRYEEDEEVRAETKEKGLDCTALRTPYSAPYRV